MANGEAQVSLRYGGRDGVSRELSTLDSFVVVRSYANRPLEKVIKSDQALALLQRAQVAVRFPNAGVQVLRCEEGASPELRERFGDEAGIHFAGRCLVNEVGLPIVYTENLFLKLRDDAGNPEVRDIQGIFADRISKVRRARFCRKGYRVNLADGIGRGVFEICQEILQRFDFVEYCQPELVSEMRHKSRFSNQWHIWDTGEFTNSGQAHAHVDAAWAYTRGEGSTIAVIDDGVDYDHPEFRSFGKIVAPYDATQQLPSGRPYYEDDEHGTACAGVACADGVHGASGVAPAASLIPIRLRSGLGSMDEADAFYWAFQHGADVISCSWGPPDGPWWDPDDAAHDAEFPLPDSTRAAIDSAIDYGRRGRGCVITWAAGNGNESVDNDGYASYASVIAVAACSDQAVRSGYSDFGNAIHCCFPSGDVDDRAATPGIWTTDRVGNLGYNRGNTLEGDEAGYYTNSFSGTSSACPGVAGVAALMLSVEPDLTWSEVKEALGNTAERIDDQDGEYGGVGQRSQNYGYGRVNAEQAVGSVY